MTQKLIIGVDPGLVHTGVVGLLFDSSTFEVHRMYQVVNGPDHLMVGKVIEAWQVEHGIRSGSVHTFIEDYRPRSHFGTDTKMTKAVRDMATLYKSKVINNTGVKKVIRRALMDALHVWDFKTTTHHQDLRSAAYILLYGMVKNEELNTLLAAYASDLSKHGGWDVFD